MPLVFFAISLVILTVLVILNAVIALDFRLIKFYLKLQISRLSTKSNVNGVIRNKGSNKVLYKVLILQMQISQIQEKAQVV